MSKIQIRVARGNGLLKELKARISGAKEVLLASAYVSPAGIEELLPSIAKLLKGGGSLSLYATFDGTTATKPEAFQKLIALKREYPKRVELFLYPQGHSLFHAKVFLFKSARGWSGIIGSANLTRAALTGNNVEVAVDCQPLADSEVKKVRDEISKLRMDGFFMPVSEENLAHILRAFNIPQPVEKKSYAEQYREREKQAAREQRVERLLRAPPEKLPPLAELAFGSRTFVEELAAGGLGVGLACELDDVSLAIQLDPFVRAGVVLKQKKESVGGIGYTTTKQGQGIVLVPASVREAVSAAARSMGSAIGAASIDLGFARWMPRLVVPRLLRDLKTSEHVLTAKATVRTDSTAVHLHLEAVRKQFSAVVSDIIAKVQLEPDLTKWSRGRTDEVRLWPARMSEGKVREKLSQYVEKTYRPRVSNEFVQSKLARLSFEPSTFEFPLERLVGADADFGHRHFLACLVWAATDPLMKKTDGGKGRGEVFAYLNARLRLNLGRHKLEKSTRLHRAVEHYASEASRWLADDADLDKVVEGFRTFYGDAPWTWDVTDLVTS